MLNSSTRTNNENRVDLDLLDSWVCSFLKFVADIWELTPQPLKPEYMDRMKDCDLNDVQESWFLPFVKGKHLSWQQYLIALAIERGLNLKAPRKIAVKSGHSIGKSTILAMALLWFLATNVDAQVPATAPTSYQMHDVLWKEVSLWIQRMPEWLKAKYEWSTGYIRMKDRPESWFARARTARKEQPEALAGIHADAVMVVIDEASGVPDECIEAAKSALTNKNIFFIMISNPTRIIGYFYDVFDKHQDQWQTLTFDTTQSPVADEGYVQEIRSEHGEDSDIWRFRIKGLFPRADGADTKGYSPLFIESDIHECADSPFTSRKRLGVDCAGAGKDKSVWVIRDRFKAKIVASEDISTPKSIAQQTLTLIKSEGVNPEDVYIDNFGVGANVAQECALAGVRVNGVNSGDEPEDKERYVNKRAEMAWRSKEWIRQGGDLVKHKAWQELKSIRYKASLLNSKLKIMAKDEMKKEGYKSPDHFDAFALTFFDRDIFDFKASQPSVEESHFDRFAVI